MIKLSALNVKSDEESGSEELVAREGLDEIASQEYARALELQRKGNLPDAIQLLKDLLDTQVLFDVKKPAPNEKVPGPLFVLKYLCYKNLASMLSISGDVEAAIEAYCEASELDSTDVTLWHRLGLLCVHAKRYEMALDAFKRGLDCNAQHWPCLDRVVTLLLGMDMRQECIAVIYEALQLDPGYLRGLVYRRHIYTVYKFERDYLEYVNPIYKWNENDDGKIDEEKAEKLLQEADEIRNIFIDQLRAEQFDYILPHLKLKKPITELSWKSVGDALVDMHHYMTENCFSHACPLEIIFKMENHNDKMEICIDIDKEPEILDRKVEDNVMDTEKNMEIVLERENNDVYDKDKPVTDTEKIESDNESTPEPKTQKKKSGRRRGSDLSYLQQWEWCNRRSGRKNTTSSTTYRKDESIYDTLRRMIPIGLVPKVSKQKVNEEKETTHDISDLNNLFQDKQDITELKADIKYFNSENEEEDVRLFIDKYTERKHDIIDILRDYLEILAGRWRLKWPDEVVRVFIEANKCYNNHIDIPACTDDNNQELIHYTLVNLLAEELIVNEKLNLNSDENKSHDLGVVEPIGIILSLKPHIFQSTDCLEYILRQLWVKLHIHKLNKCDALELDTLYGLMYEFHALGEQREFYNLNVTNFIFKSDINLKEILESIIFIERNMKLKTVKNLYNKGNYEEVLTIVIDCFEHFKTLAKQQEDRLTLDFAVYLTIILDTYWALGKVEDCFKWCFTCLHEALKHYFRYTSGSDEYEKWTLTVLKILCSIEHILTNEGLTCLDVLSTSNLSQALEDLIRIIGHQVETNAAEMPFDTVAPWIIMHYILQREEDQGRGESSIDLALFDYIPCPLMVLFIGHEKLGKREWCTKCDAKLLYFILDTVVPRLRTPSLSKSLEMVCLYMEQCVHCLFDHRGRKSKYMDDHKATPQILDWHRAQQLYEIFRPSELPALEGKVSSITLESEFLFHQILALVPPECDPHKYVPEIEKYMKGIEDKVPIFPPLLPYKMKDLYFLFGDYYFKKDKNGIKYNTLDVIINNDRFESWAQISLAKAVKLEHFLNSCKTLKNDKEFLNPAATAIRCFKRSLDLNPNRVNVWIEYGNFAYAVHSFCSRSLKQASESLSMEDFESLEKQKEDMLDTTQKSFNIGLGDFNNRSDIEKWQIFYILGKVAEKRNKPPSIYLDYYMQGIKCLREIKATYPAKINYSSPTKLCIEVLELHYRIHASILKYIEQHENKPIPESVGKVFASCIEEWLQGPFARKRKQDGNIETERDIRFDEPVQAANILKRSISDAGEEDSYEAKRLKLESAAAKVRRSASHDTERFVVKETQVLNEIQPTESSMVIGQSVEVTSIKNQVESSNAQNVDEKDEKVEKITLEENQNTMPEKKEDSSSSTSSTSSSDSSSSDSTTDSSSDSGRDSDTSSKSSNESKPLTEDEIMKIVSACLDALEECASRFPQHYKAIYRLAHYHFYFKKGRDIERCRDLMLSTFTSRFGQKLGGLFSERKHNNFFNNVWKIPSNEVDRGGSFPFHMNRSVLLTLEILKEIDDHKTLLDLSLHLQKIPDRDKKYLRDSDREELAQQAFSLCVQSLKGQLIRFSQQADLKSNDVEQAALKSLMRDIYNAHQRVQKQPNSKQFTNLLIDGYKLISTGPFENKNLVDLSMKYCQSLKQQATVNTNLDKSKNLQKKQVPKPVECGKASTVTFNQPKPEAKQIVSSSSLTSTASTLPKISAHDMSAAFQSYVPLTSDQLLAQQTAAALSYFNNISTMALQSTLQYSLQNSFQAEFYRQCVGHSLSAFNLPPQKKQKRAPKATFTNRPPTVPPQMKPAKPNNPQSTAIVKPISTTIITNQKSTSTSLAPSMGTVLPTLPASMTANLSTFGGSSHSHATNHSSLPAQAHMTSTSTVNASMHTKPPMPHQQVSPGKTLQEKLAERQKNLPSVSKAAASHDVSREINQSINRLPSSLTITKTSMPKQPLVVGKRSEAKKTLPFSEQEPRSVSSSKSISSSKPISSSEIIVLDDD